MTIDPLVLMTDVEDATAALLGAVESLTDAEMGLPSLLPGWTTGHVLTHLARNADALTNLLTWARTGVETPAYASPEARAAGIEAGAGRPLAEQLADLRQAHDRFADAAAAMPETAWAVRLPLARSAAAVPWLRLCEIEVHRVDLGRGYTPDDWPEAFALRLLRAIVTDPPAGSPDMVLRPFGLEHPLVIGPGEGPVVGGPTRSIAAWLIGRADGADLTVSPDGELPQPARWR
ncbi:maleylpyruvate isomerase family mycothiol-dependent enzyme [Actinoplanes sp. NEAU-A12]|uniref:Maleylpyruvate isomerase family mycothiol-dependent enzyme n=1 Tax=Actinoplanes sandaracinus TaxID=3045177 RepID=A0ABT6X035_9ACTN|nr:maleylpyruvate isomerase family mycothiol-dependent enzyme [Actinoplanes sandaracinus]MDI6105359.1 maleylpyruvate isomerase family mycothiol-dependent enzyme [Actinoplanes sandaracinus]